MANAGVTVIPEDRHQACCVLGMTVAENLVLDDVQRVCNRRIISPRLIRRQAEELIEQFGIKTPSPNTPMASLSGGNQQRVVLARAIRRGPQVMVAAQIGRASCRERVWQAVETPVVAGSLKHT